MATNQRFTEKAQEAILQAQRQTDSLRLSQFEPEIDSAGTAQPAGWDRTSGFAQSRGHPQQALRDITTEVERLPKLPIQRRSVRQCWRARKLLENAEKEAKQFGDEYISTEHLLLGALDVPGSAGAAALKRLGLTNEKAKVALRDIRGGQRVTSTNPEATYQSLEKYGQDLTELARKGKLDPVIGRDEEIRRVIQVLSRRTRTIPC